MATAKKRTGAAPRSSASQRAREAKQPRQVKKLSKDERVERIIRLMVTGAWVTGKTAPELAAKWKLAPNTVEHDAAEASRRIRDLVDPQERAELKARFLAKLEGVQEAAIKAKRFEAAKGLLELEGKALGHFEPEKVEVSGNLGELLQLGLAPGGETAD